MEINQKLILGFLILSLIPLTLVSYINYNQFSSTLTENSILEIHKNTLSNAHIIKDFLNNAKSDVSFLSELPNLKDLINSDNSQDLQNAKNKLQQEFLAFSENKNIYYQIRYIDETGQEIVRIDSDGINSMIIPEENLQNKKGRYYFDDAMTLKKGGLSISPLDLNIEQGELENRGTEENPVYVTVIRYGTPVFDKNNNKKGIVLTNIYADTFLKDIHDNKDSNVKTLLLNKDGFYLSHSDKTKEFGFMFKNNENIKNDFPKLASSILINEPGSILKGDNFISSSPVFPSKNDYWVIASIIPKNKVFESAIKLRNRTLFVGAIVIVLVILISVFLSKKITEDIADRDELLDSLLKTFEGKFGKVASILMRKNVNELIKKNPRIEKILPKSLRKSNKKEGE